MKSRRGVLLAVSPLLGVAVYAVARVLLLNNGTAVLFPREIEALALGGFGLAILPAFLEKQRVAFTATAALSLALFAFLTLPSLAATRLDLFRSTMPLATQSDPVNRPVGCFCATRASLHELFGPPDFATAGMTDTAPTYAYRIGGSATSPVVMYRLETGQSAFDRVVAIDEMPPMSDDELRSKGLARWGSR